MRAAPFPASEMTYTEEDRLVADPLIHETDQLWKETARKNREIFTEIFRPVPSNLVQNVDTYDVCVNFFCFRLHIFLDVLFLYTNNRLSVLHSKREGWPCCQRCTFESCQRSPELSPRVTC